MKSSKRISGTKKIFFNEIECCWYDFISWSNKSLKIPGTLLRWFITLFAPIILGVYVGGWIEAIKAKTFRVNWSLFLEDYPALICLALIFFMWMWRNKRDIKECNQKRLLDLISGIFEDLDIKYDENTSDIRCTIWTPVDSKSKLNNMRIVQLIDYYPKLRGNDEITINGTNGRIRLVSRYVKGALKPVGIVGKCIFESLRDNEAKVLLANIDLNKHDHYLQNTWNFTDAEIKRLAQGRVSYLCFALMNAQKQDLLGVLYFDSSISGELNSEFSEAVEYYLPRIGRMLVE